jgi:hypothetical protein
MFISITKYTKLFPDSFMIVVDEILMECAASNNINGFIPESRFDAQLILDFVHARKNLHSVRNQCSGVLPPAFALTEDGATLYFGNCWETAEDFAAYRSKVEAEGHQVLLEQARAALVQKFGLKVETFEPVSTADRPADMTLEKFISLVS